MNLAHRTVLSTGANTAAYTSAKLPSGINGMLGGPRRRDTVEPGIKMNLDRPRLPRRCQNRQPDQQGDHQPAHGAGPDAADAAEVSKVNVSGG